MPFASGACKCVGDTFAVTEATLALATVAKHWQLRHASDTRVRPAPKGLLTPGGLRMRACRRRARPLEVTGQ
ncbi:hypothetical protein [Streptomyces sp. NPDC059003]|uniref:hypothetical protein n=1 Tax=Streptomyces sp. NPDC059003 TaxID=3346691 RepID=UPI003699F27A